MMSSNKIVIYSLIITAVMLTFTIFITKYFTTTNNNREEINFPFRAIWKEMPEFVKQGYKSPMEYTTKSAYKPITNDIYYETLQQPSQTINEIYPITYTKG